RLLVSSLNLLFIQFLSLALIILLVVFLKSAPRRQGSERADAVETAAIVLPLRIAEIGPSFCERIGAHRRPDWTGQVRASFHHGRGVARPRDDEAELIVS